MSAATGPTVAENPHVIFGRDIIILTEVTAVPWGKDPHHFAEHALHVILPHVNKMRLLCWVIRGGIILRNEMSLDLPLGPPDQKRKSRKIEQIA